MEFTNSVFFWPTLAVVLLIFVLISAKLFFRLAIFIAALLLIWFCFGYVGLVPPPADFFKGYHLPGSSTAIPAGKITDPKQVLK